MRTAMKNFRSACVALAAITVYILTAHVVTAQDRPGTPNHLTIEPCGVWPAVTGAMLCVEFYNTAKEEVTFEYQTTENGGPGPHIDGYPYSEIQGIRSQCFGRDTYVPPPRRQNSDVVPIDPFGCAGNDSFNGSFITTAHGRTNIDIEKDGVIARPQKFRIYLLKFDTQYCIRARSRAKDTDRVSENWSAWACATTESRLPRPPAPKDFDLVYSGGGPDWRISPPTVNLSWRVDKRAAAYTIEEGYSRDSDSGELRFGQFAQILPNGKVIKHSEPNAYKGWYIEWMQPTKLPQLTLSYSEQLSLEEYRLGSKLEFRVCAESDAGRACSRPIAAQPLTGADKAGIDLKHKTGDNPGREIPAPIDPARTQVTQGSEDKPGRKTISVPPETGRVARPTFPMTGSFDSDFGLLVLTNTGGTYSYKKGVVTITKIYGNSMEGIWSQSESSKRCLDGRYRGTFHFEFTQTGFTGKYGLCDSPPNDGTWNGKRRQQT